MALYIGTSGWAYKEWKPDFYPEKLPQAKFLRHYGAELTACEINATFYRMQTASTFTKWAAETPDAFRFAVKAHQGLTHGKEVAAEPEFLDAFLRSLAPLGPKLGVILVQLPPYRKRDDAALERLFKGVPASRSIALEFRNATWDAEDVRARIAAAGATVCLAETEGKAPAALPPGRVAYVRLRGERYDDAARAAWLELLRRESAARDVYVFAKHEGVPAGDPNAGVGLAQWLMRQVRAG